MADKQFLFLREVGGYRTLYSEEILYTRVAGWKGYLLFIIFKWQMDNDLNRTMVTVLPQIWLLAKCTNFKGRIWIKTPNFVKYTQIWKILALSLMATENNLGEGCWIVSNLKSSNFKSRYYQHNFQLAYLINTVINSGAMLIKNYWRTVVPSST